MASMVLWWALGRSTGPEHRKGVPLLQQVCLKCTRQGHILEISEKEVTGLNGYFVQ